MGGSVLLEGCPDDDMDLVCRGRVELMAVDGVLPDTSVRLEDDRDEKHSMRSRVIKPQRLDDDVMKCLPAVFAIRNR